VSNGTTPPVSIQTAPVYGLSYTQQGIAYTIVAAFVIALFLWMLFPPKAVDQVALAIINMLVGALITKFSTVVDFLFGSSQGNKEKDTVQNDVMRTLVANAGTGGGTGGGSATVDAVKAAEKVAPAAAERAAPAAAERAAPPAAEVAAPPAAEAAVAAALAERDHPVT
jgi:hypothetical protein